MSPNPQTTKSSSGARYYHSDISIWLSVDPMADKYPGISPYMYCAGNPVVLVDPDGRNIYLTKEFINSPFNSVFINLYKNNSVYKKFVIPFSGNEYYHYTLKYRPINEYIVSDADQYFYVAYTQGVSGKKDDNSFHYSSADSYFNSINRYKKPVNNVSIAKTLIHEAMHGRLIYNLENGGDFSYCDQDGFIAKNYRNDIVSGLREYVKDNKIANISEKEIQLMSWSGLTQTKEFNDVFNTKSKVRQYFRELRRVETKKLKYEGQGHDE